MSGLPSIRSLLPLEIGGRIARIGFSYQDHVGISCLLDMLDETNNIKEVWFEKEDDITIITEENGQEYVEFIQVKSSNLDSRWSVPQILDIVKKSLQHGRCLERATYSIATLYDVNNELEVLKLPFDIRDKVKVNELISNLIGKLGDIKNDRGEDVGSWVNNCKWRKYPDSIEALKTINLQRLRTILRYERNAFLFDDQVENIYSKLLVWVFNASFEDVILNTECYKISLKQLNDWLDFEILSAGIPKGGTEKLELKLNQINIDDVTINSAKEMKWKYKSETLSHTFFSANSINLLQMEIAGKLHQMKLDFDNDYTKADSKFFHKECCDEVSIIAQKNNISVALGLGCMYDITNRCSHRFTKPQI
jgi:hypothetical protein